MERQLEKDLYAYERIHHFHSEFTTIRTSLLNKERARIIDEYHLGNDKGFARTWYNYQANQTDYLTKQ